MAYYIIVIDLQWKMYVVESGEENTSQMKIVYAYIII